MYVIKEPTSFSFEKVGIKGKIFPISELTSKLACFTVDTKHGHETTIIQHVSDFIYYVIEGNGYFLIDGNVENCEKGNLIVIPNGKKFVYKGKMRLLGISVPPWKLEQEETIK